jgi:hypothetical protein
MKIGTISRALAVHAVRLTTWTAIQPERVYRIRGKNKEISARRRKVYKRKYKSG